jgi:hypothetical protein
VACSDRQAAGTAVALIGLIGLIGIGVRVQG